jgi:hypothetical protein
MLTAGTATGIGTITIGTITITNPFTALNCGQPKRRVQNFSAPFLFLFSAELSLDEP